jgi:2-oxoglutarate dehydrogenase E1 component
MSLEKEFHGPNLGYILELYERYRDDPSSVDEATRKLFEAWSPTGTESVHLASPTSANSNLLSLTGAANLAQAIRLYGYLSANLDPLNGAPGENPLLTLEFYNLQKEDLLDLPADILNLPGRENENAHQAIDSLRSIYCGTIGYDYGHIRIPEERDWLYQAAEAGRFRPPGQA